MDQQEQSKKVKTCLVRLVPLMNAITISLISWRRRFPSTNKQTVKHMIDTLPTNLGKIFSSPKLKARIAKVYLALSQNIEALPLRCCFPITKALERCHVGQRILRIHSRGARNLRN